MNNKKKEYEKDKEHKNTRKKLKNTKNKKNENTKKQKLVYYVVSGRLGFAEPAFAELGSQSSSIYIYIYI